MLFLRTVLEACCKMGLGTRVNYLSNGQNNYLQVLLTCLSSFRKNRPGTRRFVCNLNLILLGWLMFAKWPHNLHYFLYATIRKAFFRTRWPKNFSKVNFTPLVVLNVVLFSREFNLMWYKRVTQLINTLILWKNSYELTSNTSNFKPFKHPYFPTNYAVFTYNSWSLLQSGTRYAGKLFIQWPKQLPPSVTNLFE